MATFSLDGSDFQRVDWMLLQNGPVSLYFRHDALDSDVAWRRAHGYRVEVLDILADNARCFLLFGRRLLVLVQSDDPRITFAPVGATASLLESEGVARWKSRPLSRRRAACSESTGGGPKLRALGHAASCP